MIIDMRQTHSSTGFVFSAKDDPDLYHAHVKLGIESPDIDLIQKNEKILKLNSDEVPKEVMSIFSWEKVLSYIKKPNGDICGEVSLKIARKLFNWYKYIQINYNAELLNCYEVRRGKEGVFVCIYLGNNQIAMIEKSMFNGDNKDKYKIYIKNCKYLKIICLYAVYYDYFISKSKMEFMIKLKKDSGEYTVNKQLKSKYNPQFKEECEDKVPLEF